ncbi:MAG: tetratricopeptide repeat protein [Lewinellaceae bacterium]|nr:tetratricopeptide repeat protein [Lewinellaceae bacterium]
MTTLVKKAFFLLAIVYAQVAAAQTRADGLAAMQLEEWDKAITIYTALTKADPTDQDAFLTLSNAYLAKGDKAKALEIAQAAFTAKPEDPMSFVANAKVLQLKDNASGASEQFDRAAKKAKKNINALRQIGECFTYYTPPGSKRPDLTRATELLKIAVDYNSKDIPSLMALGYAYKEQGNGGFAATNYEQAESLDPKNPLPKLMLAKVYKAAKVLDKFEIYINKTIEVAPKYSSALRTKAEFLFFARRWEEATKAYEDLVNKGDVVTIEDEMQLANCLYITHQCPACSELVEKILKKDPPKTTCAA